MSKIYLDSFDIEVEKAVLIDSIAKKNDAFWRENTYIAAEVSAALANNQFVSLERAERFLHRMVHKYRREIAVGFNSRGEYAFNITGGEYSIEIPDSMMEEIKEGGVLTHSHPDDEPLSWNDIYSSAIWGLWEIRAVTPCGTVHTISAPTNLGGKIRALEKFVEEHGCSMYTTERILTIFAQEHNLHYTTLHIGGGIEHESGNHG